MSLSNRNDLLPDEPEPRTPKVGVWDTVLELGTYQHVTLDGEPTMQVFDAGREQAMLDDFAAHPESDIFYDRFHEVTDEVPGEEGEPLSSYRDRLLAWAKGEVQGDGKALAWANALCLVVGGRVARYVPHPGAPPTPPTYEKLCQDQGRKVPDGVYCLRSEITPRGADPREGLAVTRYTSPYYISQRDGERLLCLTATNDPRMRGAALARFERGRAVVMTRMTAAPAPPGKERRMDEIMTRAGCMESDTPEQKLEKMSAYARKMEEEGAGAKKAFGDLEILHKDAMGRIAKMEEEKKGAAEKKPDEDGEKAAMQRELQSVKEKLNVVLEAQKRAAEQREADQKVAMQRAQQERELAADRWADQALAEGRWDAMHAGGDKAEQDPVKRIAMTRAHLAKKYKADPAQAEADLFDRGFFKPSEAAVMQRLTAGGAAPGAPQPPTGDSGQTLAQSVDALMDQAISQEMQAAQKAGQTIDIRVAMQRVKAKNPALVSEYNRAAGGRN